MLKPFIQIETNDYLVCTKDHFSYRIGDEAYKILSNRYTDLVKHNCSYTDFISSDFMVEALQELGYRLLNVCTVYDNNIHDEKHYFNFVLENKQNTKTND